MSHSRTSHTLSRKRQKELRELRAHAEELLHHQREVLGHAGTVLHEAGRQARHLNNEVVRPRVNEAIEQARPVVSRRVAQAQRAADRARVVTGPIIAAALAGAVRSLERLENTEAAHQLRGFGEQHGLIAAKPKRKRRGGGIAIGLAVAAAGVVGYALWQAFRSDDELWVAPSDS